MRSLRLALIGVVFATGVVAAGAQESGDSTRRDTTAPAAPQAAFDLIIDAPPEIRELLELQLDLYRYREQGDLSDSEVARLQAIAELEARNLVATLGYFSPDIRFIPPGPASIPVSGMRRPVRSLTLMVQPGEPTVVTDVALAFEGQVLRDAPSASQRQHIEDAWSLPPGTRFTQARWDAAKRLALQLLSEQNYPLARLRTSTADIDPVTRQAHLSVQLDSGPRYQIGALAISGLERYDAALVTRLARLSPGSAYDQSELVKAQQRLTDSGYFESAFVSLDTTGDPSAAPVRVQLRETRLQKLVFGLGASTDGGGRLSVEHTHHKVPGLGWRAVSKLLLDRETQALGTELIAPPDADGWRWVTAAQHQTVARGSFEVNSRSLRVGRGQIAELMDRNYHLQYDRADTATGDASAPSVAATLSANYAFTLRRFDSLPFPSHGWGAGVEVGGGSTLGVQQDPFGRVVVRGLGYLPLGGSGVTRQTALRAGRLVMRAEGGAVLAAAGISLPSTQLFLTGGDTSVRGYAYRSIGVALSGGQITAGRYMANGSLEWQRPIVSSGRLSDWEGTAFIDAGAVADTPAALHANVGVGVGARWKSPVGPLQINLAYAVATERFRLHVNVGFNF